MKRVLFISTYFIMTATIIGFATSCSKISIKEETIKKTSFVKSPEETKVLDFIDKYQQKKDGSLRSEGSPMSIDDAFWYWSAVFNYRHGEPNALLKQIQYDTIFIDFPKTDINGHILESDVFNTYTTIINQARNHYINIELDEKTLQMVQINPDSETKDHTPERIEIILIVGSRTTTSGPFIGSGYGQPFDEDDNWYWGEQGGNCEEHSYYGLNNNRSDAAQELTKAINFYEIWPSIIGNYTDCVIRSGMRPYIFNIPNVSNAMGLSSDENGLFHTYNGLHLCISWENMNKFYTNIMVAVHENEELTSYKGMPFFKIAVLTDYIVSFEEGKIHYFDAFYAETYRVYYHTITPLEITD